MSVQAPGQAAGGSSSTVRCEMIGAVPPSPHWLIHVFMGLYVLFVLFPVGASWSPESSHSMAGWNWGNPFGQQHK